MERFWNKVDRSSEIEGACWPWLGRTDGDGYGMFSFEGRRQKASRVSYFLTHGEFDRSLCVCHSCDNPPCVNPAHLWLGTRTDNVRDMYSKNRQHGKRYADNPVDQIFARLGLATPMEVANLYGVTDRTVRRWIDGSRDPGAMFYKLSEAFLTGWRPSPQGERQ